MATPTDGPAHARVKAPSGPSLEGHDVARQRARAVTRAIQQRQLWNAEIAAREMRGLALADALELVILIAAQRPDRLERAAVRWHGRLEVELPMLTLAESRFALAALERLPADPQAAELLRKLLRQASPTTLRRIQ